MNLEKVKQSCKALIEEIERGEIELQRRMNGWIEIQDTLEKRNVRAILKGEANATLEELTSLLYEVTDARDKIVDHLQLEKTNPTSRVSWYGGSGNDYPYVKRSY
jgi:hypothetical protein